MEKLKEKNTNYETKERMKKRRAKVKGITLVALVVTIVVLLILAGVTINTILGDNGIITKAQQAKEATIKSNTISEIQTEILIAQMDGDITQAKLEEILSKYAEGGATGILKDEDGNITGIKVEGLATAIPIEEIYNGTVGSTPPGPSTIPVTGITLNTATAELVAIGDTVQLTATINPDNATDKVVTWNSSAEGVATVSDSGLVTAVSVGTATITVTTNDGSKTATCNVTVLGWDLSKVNKVIVDGQNIPVPKGYSLSQATGENSIATGLVLYEGEGVVTTSSLTGDQSSDPRYTRNQFVWVPVTETELNKMVEKYDATNYRGKLYDFGFNGTTGPAKDPIGDVTYSATGYREPDVVTGSDGASYDAVSTNLEQAGLPSGSSANDFKTQLQNEFNSMVESVKLYKGFYIGRYETSGLSDTDTTVTPTVLKGKGESDGINNVTWYRMYNESKNIKGTKTNVTSSMIWGCQWDATLRWFLTSEDEDVRTFVTNSTGKGHYSSSIAKTGSKPAYAVNNIYDMAGNVLDLTLEAYNADKRVTRGGNYSHFGSSGPASYRINGDPSVSGILGGSRSTLLLNP